MNPQETTSGTMAGRRAATLHEVEHAEELLRLGRFEAARDLYTGLLRAGVDGYALRANFAQCLKREGAWSAAIEQFEAAFRLHRPMRESGDPEHRGAVSVPVGPLRAFYVQHLIEQLDYLQATGRIDWFSADERKGLERLRRFLRDCYGVGGEGKPPADLPASITALATGCAHYSSQDRVEVRINPDAQVRKVDLGVAGSPVYVVDDFFDQATLVALRRFLVESTIWFDARPERGYLGAFLHDGLACRLIERASRAVLDYATRYIGSGILSQVWAFKYAPSAAGIDLHADQADWNVNVWLTDEVYNLDRDTGGMTIYGCKAPPEWKFEMYNASPDAVRDYLAAANAKSEKIEYRGNRATIFDSRLFHKTDPVRFSDAYQGRRINMTVMIDTQPQGADF